ncbi:MAG: anti-sigma factor [Chloroflexi bacterium]|nr:anti-sigma factor [Chloroflexota bacterium]
MRTVPLFGHLLGLVTAALVLLAMPSGVHANGTPINVVLQYLNGVSNWGPTNASGVAEIITGEGEVRLQATGLPRLTGERYQLWIIDSSTNTQLPLGAFNASPDGVGRLDLVLDQPIPDSSWNLLVVTVEAEGAPPATPSNRRSIAGRIAEPGPGGSTRPAELPRTGGPPDDVPPSTRPLPVLALIVGALGVLVLGGMIGYGLGRRGSQGETR